MSIYILNKESLFLTLFISNHCFLNSLSIYKHHLLEFYYKSLYVNKVYHCLPINIVFLFTQFYYYLPIHPNSLYMNNHISIVILILRLTFYIPLIINNR